MKKVRDNNLLALIDSLNSIIENLQTQIKQRNEEISQIQNKLEQEKEKNKSYDIEKAKANFENLIKEKNNKIEELNKNLIDYENLKQTNQKLYDENDTLKRYREFNLKDFASKINTDESFRSTLRHLILSDKQTYKLIIKILNIKEDLLKEADKIYEQKFIDENLELDKLREEKESLKNEVEILKSEQSNIKTETKQNKSDLIISMSNDDIFGIPSNTPKMIFNQNEFNKEVMEQLSTNNDNLAYYNNLLKKLEEENFVIIENEADINVWTRAQDYFDSYFPPLKIIPEYDWTSIYDWFGYFENGKFIPSKTKISDYYKFVKTENLPLGVVIFYDFNKIMPEIYLEPFMQSIKINKKFDLVHQNLIVNEESEIFKQITIPKELKFVFIKSKSPKAFEIPYSMKKYEVVSD